ncbi:hypothetical protein [Streptosporangium roseum]|uniref:hypothetical protein n=1 Tax=Streptosporangium roseum TaxID=2001 RepID=UPI00332AE77E
MPARPSKSARRRRRVALTQSRTRPRQPQTRSRPCSCPHPRQRPWLALLPPWITLAVSIAMLALVLIRY